VDTAFGNVGAVEETLITIYLPSVKSSITENQGWDTESANNAAAASLAGMAQEGDWFDKAGASISNAIGSGLGKVNQMAAGAASRSGQGYGVMEQQALKYNGPEQRGLTCTYNFVPRSRDETKVVHEIIKKFRFHAAPKRGNLTDLSGDGTLAKMVSSDVGVRTYKFPSLFKIRWLNNGGGDNEWLPKYNTCYCESVAVEYGDEKFTTFNNTSNDAHWSGAPTTYTLTLTFKELDYPTKERIDGGF
jgi:hypothetical protein